MIRFLAIWGVFLAALILFVVSREERLATQGKVPLGRLRRLWMRPERRGAPRYRVNWQVRYLRLESDPPLAARTRDVSQTGAGMVVEERLPAGSFLQVQLVLPDSPDPVTVTARVAWSKEMPAQDSTPGASRSFFIGVQFQNLSAAAARRIGRALRTGILIPPEMPTETEARARRYALARRSLWLVDLGLGMGILAAALATGIAQSLSGWVTAQVQGWPLQVAVYLAILGTLGALLFFPLDWFRGFFLEHRFGLSTQRFGAWLVDHAKGLALSGLLGLIFAEGLSALLHLTPRHWWIWTALFWMALTTILTRAAPLWLIPLFYRQRPIEDPSLRRRLEELLERCRTPVRGIFEVNLSRTTRKANACLCGLGRSRRVLVSDTLLSAYPAEEVEVVLAHELGHHRRRHIAILLGTGTLAMGLSLLGVHLALRAAMKPLGLGSLQDPAALLVIGLGLAVTQLFLMPVTHGLSRRLEAQADRFALEKTRNPQAFIATMRRLAQQNLAEVSPPRWVEWLFYDHPSIARRIAMAEQFGGP